MQGGWSAWLVVVELWSAFEAVQEAEALARELREPFGTLVLTMSVSAIEVVLICAAMFVDDEVTTMARDAMFSVLMIVLNGVVGVGLLMGGYRYHEQLFNLQGATAYLSVVIPLSTIALVLPSFTVSTTDGTLTLLQSVCFSIMTLFLYLLFLWLQVGRHQAYFTDAGLGAPAPSAAPPEETRADDRRTKRLVTHTSGLLFCMVPISLLATPLAELLDRGLSHFGMPSAVGGIVIALLVFAPEGMSTLIAVGANQLTKAINVSLGAATSTLGISVPLTLFIGMARGQPVVLGLPPAGIVLLAVTLLLTTLTFLSARTTMLVGAVHLSLFVAFLVLAFNP
jgi:Ca2+:H+ antiporter